MAEMFKVSHPSGHLSHPRSKRQCQTEGRKGTSFRRAKEQRMTASFLSTNTREISGRGRLWGWQEARAGLHPGFRHITTTFSLPGPMHREEKGPESASKREDSPAVGTGSRHTALAQDASFIPVPEHE